MKYQVPADIERELRIHDEDEYRDGDTIKTWLEDEYYRGWDNAVREMTPGAEEE